MWSVPRRIVQQQRLVARAPLIPHPRILVHQQARRAQHRTARRAQGRPARRRSPAHRADCSRSTAPHRVVAQVFPASRAGFIDHAGLAPATQRSSKPFSSLSAVSSVKHCPPISRTYPTPRPSAVSKVMKPSLAPSGASLANRPMPDEAARAPAKAVIAALPSCVASVQPSAR